RRGLNGPENQSYRFPAGGESQLELALVCEQPLVRADARRGHQGARLPQAQARARLSRPRADRAAGEGCPHHHLLGTTGRGDRKEGRGDRGAQGRAAPADGRQPGACEHRGDPQARGRRPADRRLDRAAAREAHHVPARHEARDAERHAPWRRRGEIMPKGAAQAVLPAAAPAAQPETPAEPRRAKKPVPKPGARRPSGRPRPEGERKAAKKPDAPAPKTTVKRPKKVLKDEGGGTKE